MSKWVLSWHFCYNRRFGTSCWVNNSKRSAFRTAIAAFYPIQQLGQVEMQSQRWKMDTLWLAEVRWPGSRGGTRRNAQWSNWKALIRIESSRGLPWILHKRICIRWFESVLGLSTSWQHAAFDSAIIHNGTVGRKEKGQRVIRVCQEFYTVAKEFDNTNRIWISAHSEILELLTLLYFTMGRCEVMKKGSGLLKIAGRSTPSNSSSTNRFESNLKLGTVSKKITVMAVE